MRRSAVWLSALVGCAPGGAQCPPGQFAQARDAVCVSAVVQVVAGASHTCALHGDLHVSCWGLGEALDGSGGTVVAPREMPMIAGARAIAAGDYGTCAVAGAEGRVTCWGNRGMTVDKESGGPLMGATTVAVGHGFACAATSDGAYCWGDNVRGQLARPLEVATSVTALLALPGAQSKVAAGETVVAHGESNQLCAWGDNASQVVASTANGLYSEPWCVPMTDVAQVAVGSVHACIRRGAGTVACWGERYYGQLGIGGTADDTADIPPYGTPSLLPAVAVDVVAGSSHTCALLADGDVACFGLNDLGQVGPAAAAGSLPGEDQVRKPVVVEGFSRPVTRLGAGSSAQHTCAIVEDGSVECWGKNHAGQLGDRVTHIDPARFSATPTPVLW